MLVSARLELDPSSELFHGGAERTIVVTPASSPADRRALLADVAEVVVAGDDALDVDAALDALANAGSRACSARAVRRCSPRCRPRAGSTSSA